MQTKLAPTTAISRSKQMSPTQSVMLTGVLVLALTSRFITGYMILATINLFVLLTGFTLRKKNARAHAKLMALGVSSDLILVLVLQVKRHAVETAIAFKLSAWNQAHIAFSSLATLLYIPMIFLGIFLLQKPGSAESPKQKAHRTIGYATLMFRTIGYLLMFTMLKDQLGN